MRRLRWILSLVAIVGSFGVLPRVHAASAQDLQIRQLKHRAWDRDTGFPAGAARVGQLADGRLLVGGENLYTFDGLTFQPVPAAPGSRLHDGITAILGMPDGTAWVGYRDGGVGRYAEGLLRDVESPIKRGQVSKIVRSPDGSVFFVVLPNLERSVFRFRKGEWTAFSPTSGHPDDQPFDLIAARDGTLWHSRRLGVHVLEPQAKSFRPYRTNLLGHPGLAEDRHGRIWLSDDLGSRIIFDPDGRTCNATFPTPPFQTSVSTSFAQDGSLWGTNRSGTFRLSAEKIAQCDTRDAVDRFSSKDGLSSDRTYRVFHDREGMMWIVTLNGLDQFRRTSVVHEPTLSQVPRFGQLLLATRNGDIYVGASDAIYRIPPRGKPEPVLKGAGEPEVICEMIDGSVLVGLPRRMVRLGKGAAVSLDKPPATLTGLYGCVQDQRGRIWAASGPAGLFYWTGAAWREQLTSAGERIDAQLLAKRNDGIIVHHALQQLMTFGDPARRERTMLFEGELEGSHILLPFEGGNLAFGPYGFARLTNRLEYIDNARTAWLRNVRGVAVASDGTTWILGGAGLVSLAPGALQRAFDNRSSISAQRIFSHDDGFDGRFQTDGRSDVAIGGDGRIWMVTTAGAAWLNPSDLPKNRIAPGVQVLRVVADGRPLSPEEPMTPQSRVRSLEVDFLVASLTNSARNLVRYRLAGVDADWVDAGLRRTAYYSNLEPGQYTFQVIAANNDGVWNTKGAEMTIVVPPAFTDTNLFRALCVLGALLLAWTIYRFRVAAVTYRINESTKERLAERERIARDLHDTLLQGFQGLLLRFQAVVERMHPDQPQREMLVGALDRAEAVLVEGRDRVRDLRHHDGPCSLRETLEGIARDAIIDDRCTFALDEEGKGDELAPLVRDDVVLIGAEAIRNAARHAKAKRIHCLLVFARSEFRMIVTDDGQGFSEHLAALGEQEGHFGLTGMRERAERIGAELKIISQEEVGTKVELRLAASLAYHRPASSIWRFSRATSRP